MNLNPFKWIGDAISSVTKPVGEYFNEKQKIKAAVSERKDELKKLSLESKLKSIEKSEDVNNSLDEKNGADPIPWGNDVTLILLLIPCVLSFYPPAVPAVKAGFIVLQSMPDWYLYGLGMAFVSIWGYRGLVVPIVRVLISKSIIGKKSG